MNKKTDAEISAERILNAPIDPEYKEPTSWLPIPTGNGILAKQMGRYQRKSKGGIIIPDTAADNTQPPHIGIIYAVGPDCSKYMRVGTRVYINFYVNSSFYVNGEDYWKLHETDVFYIIPPETVVEDGVKSADEVRRTSKMGEQVSREGRLDRRDENEKDERLDKTKGKIRPLN